MYLFLTAAPEFLFLLGVGDARLAQKEHFYLSSLEFHNSRLSNALLHPTQGSAQQLQCLLSYWEMEKKPRVGKNPTSIPQRVLV